VRFFLRAFSASTPKGIAMSFMIAGIDVHKRVLMVAVADASVGEGEVEFQCRRFGTTARELKHLAAWLGECGVREVVMESTAQYWKPVWLALEGHFKQHLAQAWSNRAPKGRKADFKDAERLVRRQMAGELTLSFVPEAEQRQMRTLTRRRVQLIRDRVRLQNQLEALLEEMRVKLSSVVTDLLGASGRRILTALAAGESDPEKLAALGDARLKCTRQQMQDALVGPVSPVLCILLRLLLEQVEFLDRQIEELTQLTAETMRDWQDAVARLVQIPGIRTVAAQQILAETGPQAAAFPSAGQFVSWMGACPGREESAGVNHSSRCPKGNRYLRRSLCQAAQAAVRTKNSHFQAVFRRLVPRLGYTKAIWAIVRHMAEVIWKILHTGVHYEERGSASTPQAIKRRIQKLTKELRDAGYSVEITPPAIAGPQA
jgi:transposase